MVEPGFHAPPAFLLTGPAWFRLFNVEEFVRHSADPNGRRPAVDLRTLARLLHPRLDYPPLRGLAWRPRGEGLTTYQQMDLVPRARIEGFLRLWNYRRRYARAVERRRLIYADELLPSPILSLAHVVQFIAECL